MLPIYNGLGATLICLLTGLKSHQIQELTNADNPYLIKFEDVLSKKSLPFISWLKMMVEPSIKNRFSNAKAALEALAPLDLSHLPKVELSQKIIELYAIISGEKLTQTITVSNPVPMTRLEGKWEVAPHPQDPPHTPDNHAWISVYPAVFFENQISCKIHVDTSKLMANKFYERRLILQTNSYPQIHELIVRVETGLVPLRQVEKPKILSWNLLLLFVTGQIITLLSLWGIDWIKWLLIGKDIVIDSSIFSVFQWFLFMSFGVMTMPLIYFVVYLISKVFNQQNSLSDSRGNIDRDLYKSLSFVAICVNVLILLGWNIIEVLQSTQRIEINLENIFNSLLFALGLGFDCLVCGGIVAWLMFWFIDKIRFPLYKTLSIALGFSVVMGWTIGFLNPFVVLALAATGLPLAINLLKEGIKYRRQIAAHRKSEEYLIKP
jgi:hypothetical protein